MKKLFCILLTAAMLVSMSGCMVNMHETLTVPVENEAGEEVDFYTYYGEAVAPITLPYGSDNIPAGKSVNVIELYPEGVAAWCSTLSEDELTNMKLLAANIDYEIDTAKKAIEEALNAPESELSAEDREIVETEAALFDMSLLQSGISIAAFNSFDVQKRIDVNYPGFKALKLYSLCIADANGVYPVTGKAVDLKASYAIPEGEDATDVLVITPNRVVSSRHAEKVGGALEFTVPSTIGTLIVIASAQAE